MLGEAVQIKHLLLLHDPFYKLLQFINAITASHIRFKEHISGPFAVILLLLRSVPLAIVSKCGYSSLVFRRYPVLVPGGVSLFYTNIMTGT
jgi:hypothetical protein